MTLFSFFRIEFSILGIVAATYVFPVIAALCYKEYSVLPSFLIPMAAAIFFALVFFVAGRKKKIALSTRGAFVVVAFAWIFASSFGALPLYFSRAIPRFIDALWESVSGFTTTGATILGDVESLPNSINLWRAETHWLGGMGIVWAWAASSLSRPKQPAPKKESSLQKSQTPPRRFGRFTFCSLAWSLFF